MSEVIFSGCQQCLGIVWALEGLACMSVIHLFFLSFMESSNRLCYANLKPFCTDVSKKKTLNDIQITVSK